MIKTRKVRVQKGLTRKKAMGQAVKKSKGDFRGFKYDSKSGKAHLT